MKHRIISVIRFFSIVLLVVVIVVLAPHSSSAETRNQLTIANLDTSQFPHISFYFWAFDNTGAFVENIDTSELHILENSTVLAADQLEMLEPGVRFITVINEGPTLANRYEMVSRIDHVKEALLRWAQAQPATSMDDFSLLNNQGSVAYIQSNPADWVNSLNAYQPELKQAVPGLAGLSTAIDQALSSSGLTRKTPAILYITPLPENSQLEGLRNLISRAQSSQVRLFIWLVGPKTYAKEPAAQVLMQAAELTDGEFLIFSGAEALPDISSYLDPLRYVYKVSYSSAIRTPGDQSLSLQVRRQAVTLDSAAIHFSLNVQAPNPIFLSPPAAITRSWLPAEKKGEFILTPDTVEISYLLEFPDNYQRDLAYARLFVDGKLAAENTSAPFDMFTWDINKVESSNTFELKVSVQDTVGLKGETINVPVEIIVPEKPLTWFQRVTQKATLLKIIPLALVLVAGLLIVLIGLKIVRRSMTVRTARSHRLQDPVTQPVEIAGETVILAPRVESPESWPRLPGGGTALARLVLLSSGKPDIQEPHEIPLGEFAVTLGSDATKARLLLNYPLVSPLHARVFMDEEKRFHVADEGSASGTWLNYAPVSKNGAHLEHGDVVQFGKAVFRFEQYGLETKKLKVIPLGDE
jgi:hypothetical protein